MRTQTSCVVLLPSRRTESWWEEGRKVPKVYPSWDVIFKKLKTTDHYLGPSIDGTREGKPVIVIREWYGWPDIDVPLSPMRG